MAADSEEISDFPASADLASAAAFGRTVLVSQGGVGAAYLDLETAEAAGIVAFDSARAVKSKLGPKPCPDQFPPN